MPSTPLTDTAVRAAKPPLKGRVTLWDSVVRNFGLRITAKGSKTFIVLIGSGRRQSIGRYPVISLQEARSEAKRLLAEKTLGKVRPHAHAFEDAVAEYLKDRAHLRPSTLASYRRHLKAHYPFARKSIGDITLTDINRRIGNLKTSEKHHAFTAGRAFFRWCVRKRLIDRSPLESQETPPNATPGRPKRVLSDPEIVAVWKAATQIGYPFGTIVQLLILTGQRKSEIGQLRYEWIGEDRFTLPATVTKNKRPNVVPIVGMTASILEDMPPLSEDFLFPASREQVRGKATTTFNGWSKETDKLRELAGIPHFTLHDFRRTLSSGMAALGINQTVVEKLLNHVSQGTQSPIAQVYNLYEFFPEKVDALRKWDAKLSSLLSR